MGSRGIPEVTSLRLTRSQWEEMQAYVQRCLPEEACGLLAGSHETVVEVIPIQNTAHSPSRFRMDPREQVRAFERIEAQGWELLGIFHSHPAGPDHPSATDIAEAAYDAVNVIWSPGAGGGTARAFSIRDGSVSEVKLYVSDGEPGSTTEF